MAENSPNERTVVMLRRGDAGLKDGCAHVSSVLGSAVSQVRPHFPRFAKTLHCQFPNLCYRVLDGIEPTTKGKKVALTN